MIISLQEVQQCHTPEERQLSILVLKTEIMKVPCRLTQSAVEGRDLVERAQNLADFQRDQMKCPDNSYHLRIDSVKF